MEDVLATTILLLCAAPTYRQGGFPRVDQPADDATLLRAAHSRVEQRFTATIRASASRSAQQTAQAMGLVATSEPALADIDHGDWSGQALDTIQARDPDGLLAWLNDPTRGAPCGESMDAARARVGRWLDTMADTSATICAITHPVIIRAALAHALELPLRATLAMDIAPLSQTVLSHNRLWRLKSLGCAC